MSEIHTYEIDGKSYQGFFASSGEQNAPCVLIAHAWAGRDAVSYTHLTLPTSH